MNPRRYVFCAQLYACSRVRVTTANNGIWRTMTFEVDCQMIDLETELRFRHENCFLKNPQSQQSQKESEFKGQRPQFWYPGLILDGFILIQYPLMILSETSVTGNSTFPCKNVLDLSRALNKLLTHNILTRKTETPLEAELYHWCAPAKSERRLTLWVIFQWNSQSYTLSRHHNTEQSITPWFLLTNNIETCPPISKVCKYPRSILHDTSKKSPTDQQIKISGTPVTHRKKEWVHGHCEKLQKDKLTIHRHECKPVSNFSDRKKYLALVWKAESEIS